MLDLTYTKVWRVFQLIALVHDLYMRSQDIILLSIRFSRSSMSRWLIAGQIRSSTTVGYSWGPILNTGPLTWLHSVTLVRIHFQAHIWIYPTRETGSSPHAVKLLHKNSPALMAKFEIPPHNIYILLQICPLMDICIFWQQGVQNIIRSTTAAQPIYIRLLESLHDVRL